MNQSFLKIQGLTKNFGGLQAVKASPTSPEAAANHERCSDNPLDRIFVCDGEQHLIPRAVDIKHLEAAHIRDERSAP